MRAIVRTLKITGLILTLVVITGCKDPEAEMAAARDAELAVLEDSRQALVGLRAELAELETQMETASSAEEADEGEELVDVEALSAQIEAKGTEVLTTTETFTGEVIGFLNKYPMLEGEPPTEWQLQAVRMKSAEDIVVASEYIDKGGDYNRAITIYQDALKLDPDNPDLAAVLASAEELRYMTPERFAAAAKGMTESEVRAALGQVYHRNVRPYPERKVTAWFYNTTDDGAAAGVWFREDKKGAVTVYKLDYQAIEGKQGQDGG